MNDDAEDSQITVVDVLHNEFRQLADFLSQAGEPSLLLRADDVFKKALLLAAASHFERVVIDALLDFVRLKSGDDLLVEFVRRRALARQYHVLFDWDSKSGANRFFGWFGGEFKHQMSTVIRDNGELREAIEAFLELGSERNGLVHRDFGNATLNKTADEIFALYRTALPFVRRIKPDLIRGILTSPGVVEVPVEAALHGDDL